MHIGFAARTAYGDRAVTSPIAKAHANHWLLACLVVLGVLYTWGAWNISRLHSFWSPDSGVRFWMVRSALERGRLIDIGYAFRYADPSASLHPLSVYTAPYHGSTATLYPPLFQYLSAFAFRWFGWFGLALLPLFSGVCAIALISVTARRLRLPYAGAMPLLVGLATPLPLYAMVYWDHALQIMAVAACVYALLRAHDDGRARWAALAGAAVGAGVFVHELVLLAGVALLLGGLPLVRSRETRRPLLAYAAGFLPFVFGWLTFNQLGYGLARGPHTLNENDFTRGDFIHRVFDPWWVMYRTMFEFAGPPQHSGLTWLLAIALIGCLAYAWWGDDRPVTRWALWGVVAALALPLEMIVPQANGLFEATPWLVPALALVAPRAGRPRASSAHDTLLGWLGRSCVLFVPLVLLIGIDPGFDWGSRFLLTMLPALLPLVLHALRGMLAADGRAAVGTRWAFGVLVAVSLVSQAYGWRFVRTKMTGSAGLVQRVSDAPDPLLLTDAWWLPPECASARGHERLICASDIPRQMPAIANLLRTVRPASFAYIGGGPGVPPLRDGLEAEHLPYVEAPDPDVRNGLMLIRFVYQAGANAERPAPPVKPRSGAHRRRVLALYYPWYGTPAVSGNWLHQTGVDLDRRTMSDHAHYPVGGPCDSLDEAVVERHLTQAKQAGIDALVCSWWGRADRTDAAIRLLLRHAPAHGISVAVMWEQPPGAGSPNDMAGDLAYLVGDLGRQPGYLKEGGKPVVFLYQRVCQDLPEAEWSRLAGDLHAALIGDLSAAHDPAAWLGRFSLDPPGPPASAGDGLRIATVWPGIDERKVAGANGRYIDRRNGAVYAEQWRAALAQNPDWVLIGSFNQWHNGTEIEPSAELGDRYINLSAAMRRASCCVSVPAPLAGPQPAGRSQDGRSGYSERKRRR